MLRGKLENRSTLCQNVLAEATPKTRCRRRTRCVQLRGSRRCVGRGAGRRCGGDRLDAAGVCRHHGVVRVSRVGGRRSPRPPVGRADSHRAVPHRIRARRQTTGPALRRVPVRPTLRRPTAAPDRQRTPPPMTPLPTTPLPMTGYRRFAGRCAGYHWSRPTAVPRRAGTPPMPMRPMTGAGSGRSGGSSAPRTQQESSRRPRSLARAGHGPEGRRRSVGRRRRRQRGAGYCPGRRR